MASTPRQPRPGCDSRCSCRPESAHQIINDSADELAYLSITTILPAEVCEYPDSNKICAFGGGLRHMTRRDVAVDYWTDEAP